MNTLSICFLVLLIAAVAVVVFMGIKMRKQTPELVALQKDLEHAQDELSEGRGNLLRQTEGLRELGVKSTKKRSKQLNRGMADTLPFSVEDSINEQ